MERVLPFIVGFLSRMSRSIGFVADDKELKFDPSRNMPKEKPDTFRDKTLHHSESTVSSALGEAFSNQLWTFTSPSREKQRFEELSFFQTGDREERTTYLDSILSLVPPFHVAERIFVMDSRGVVENFEFGSF